MVTRIRQLLDTKQLTPTQFADFIGVGRPVMSHILSERNKPSLEVVQRIISAFPDVSLPWLLSGVGEMLGDATPMGPVTPPATEPQEAAAPASSIVAPVKEEEPIPAGEAAEPEVPQPQLPSISIPEAPAEAAPAAPVVAPAPAPAVAGPSQAFPPQAVIATTAPRAFATSPQPFPTAPAPVVAPTPAAPVLPAAAAVVQPFRAARFVPAASVPATASRKPTVADLPAPETVALAPTPGLPSAMPLLATDKPAPSLSMLPAAGKPVPEAMLPFLGEPGKEIQRIVIFYRDGSFANYQPEA